MSNDWDVSFFEILFRNAPDGSITKPLVRSCLEALPDALRVVPHDGDTVTVPRELLAKKLECTPLYEGHGEESDLPEIAATQLRADGTRIEALRDELATCRRTFLLAIQAAGGEIAIPLTAVRVCPELTLVRENKDLAIIFSVTKTQPGEQ